jgi:aconitate decarboxylase
MSDPGSKQSTSVTRDLAAWVANSQPADVPEHVLEDARLLILDGIGCGLYGVAQDWTAIVKGFVLSIGGREEAAIWGSSERVPALLAPLANGTSMHAFEYDDLHPQAVIHAGAQVLPVAFAVAEMLEYHATASTVTEAELLHAIVIGFEVGARIGLATGAGQLSRGFHPSPNSATFAAAATASRLLKLTAEQTAHAFGIAGSFGGYLMAAQYGAMVKRVHPGHAAQSGMSAALLASRGLTGTEAVLEAPYGGFASSYSDATPSAVEVISAGLGSSWEIPRFSIKFYPCCGSNHTSVDAWWALQAQASLQADDIEEIEVRCSTLTADHVGWAYVPGSVTTAQMNLTYCLAAAITDGRLTVDQFDPSRLVDPAILSLVKRIRVTIDPAIDELGRARRHFVELRLKTRDGSVLSETCEFPRGSAGNPLQPDEVVAKFRHLANQRLNTHQVAEVERSILDLGKQGRAAFEASAFTNLLVPDASPAPGSDGSTG